MTRDDARAGVATRHVQLALGANVGNRRENLRGALAAMARVGPVEAVSRLYETAPAGVEDQPPFLNAACTVRTALPLIDLLAAIKRIEWEMGRRPARVWGPRPLDIDILLAQGETESTLLLTVPHPRLAERGFVLFPLADIVGDRRHPLLQCTITELRDRLPMQEQRTVRSVGWDRWWAGSTFEGRDR